MTETIILLWKWLRCIVATLLFKLALWIGPPELKSAICNYLTNAERSIQKASKEGATHAPYN